MNEICPTCNVPTIPTKTAVLRECPSCKQTWKRRATQAEKERLVDMVRGVKR